MNSKICCVRVRLRQRGNDIVAKSENAYAYWIAKENGNNASCGLGHDFYQSIAGCTAVDLKTNASGWGMALSNVSLKFKNEISVTAANAMTNAATMSVEGAPSVSVTNVLRITDLGGLPTNGIVTIGAYGVLNLDVQGAPVHGGGVSASSARIDVHTNGTLVLSRQNLFAPARTQRVRLFGGSINYGGSTLSKSADNLLYANNLVLTDGARMYGARPRIGFQTTYPTWIVTGSEPSVCDSGAIFMDYTSGGDDTVFKLWVDDVTGDGDADFVWNGPMSLPDGSTTYDDITVRKMGEGTMLQNGVSGLKYATEIWRGSWVFGQSGVSENAQEFRLAGDTTLELAAGVSNGLGKVTVNAPATLKFGEGSLLTLNCLEVTENATLTIDGELTDATLHVAETVSASQLALMRCFDGERVTQTANGYITRRKPTGFRLLLK